ncbi:helix-turn-helix domain-containing protein [Flavilitoribacter nigricans]|uniref:AraC family transcriptional regulator n=1 Tax=Flavilitoribacter nigricans (strain ATCC 23147 / DSM 23189 / NBRC 102662 / NCIMB 1420 / SS-2) TaxID=1122177 RepID=A0A2D0NI52_FLAN2|nr:AraC family transcriptional regulator [Flavilitoribacter nigricans]PHN08161.1 AraC family transcriptional regulator [Flavilitoribacter nigricans DSM 23189 = NBRC 102662]
MENFSRYFIISEYDEQWGLYITTCGSSNVGEGMNFPAGDHPAHHSLNWERGRVLSEYHLFYLTKGDGVLETRESGVTHFSAGTAVMLFPETWHRYKPLPKSEWQAYWVGFRGRIAEHLLTRLGVSRQQPLLSVGQQVPLIHCFMEMIETSRAEFTGYQQVLAGEVTKLLGWLHAIQRRDSFSDSNIDQLMQRAKLLILNSSHKTSIESVAETLHMSYSKFRKVFCEYTGMPPRQYQLQLRIQKAILLLQDEHRPIKEIALETGFESPYYFSRFFKKKTGYSPRAYRQQLWDRRKA